MKDEQNNGQRTLALNGEPECLDFLRSKGLHLEELFLSSYERWKLEPVTDWNNSKLLEMKMYAMGNRFMVRQEFINRYGFAILHRRAIEAMRPYAPLLEIGAGSGYWTYELRKYGIDCIATDTMYGEYGFFEEEKDTAKIRRWNHHYAVIEKLNSVEAISKYPNRNLLIVWPDYDEPWAADALDIFTGQVVIYMGEGYGNATADDRFHNLLDERFGNQEVIPMPHFDSSYDRDLLICQRPLSLEDRAKQQTTTNRKEMTNGN